MANNAHKKYVKYEPRAEARRLAVAIFLLATSFGSIVHAQSRDLEAAQNILRGRQAELEREETNFRATSSQNVVPQAEREEHAEFLAELRRKFWEQCETVRKLGGEASIAQFPCVRLVATVPNRTIAPASSVQTEEEKRAAMRSRLNALEEAIDEDLMKRQQELRQAAAPPSGGGGAAGAGAQAGSTQADGGAQGNGAASAGGATGRTGSSGAGTGAVASAPGQRGGAAGSNAGPGGGQVPASPQSNAGQHDRSGVTDGGVGDDVVARQLRQAAESETDPVLKEKLWAEYRRYRGGRG